MTNLPEGNTSAAEELDLRGLKCPLPALFARRALARLPKGGKLVVVTDDPLAPVDIPHMCWREGYEVLQTEPRTGSTALILEKP
ncbi:MAG: sulfurtransferase TusA family protein [Rhizomicrobium sp.]|jgi:tRNA 2-thiouridine synthesizing protein A